MNIKLTDFGFSNYQRDTLLECYGGTQSYMAPEIIEFKAFDGHKADVFSLGVILFITVMGVFPFQSAKKEDKYFSLLCEPSKIEKFWQVTGSESTSEDFKDLFSRMTALNPDNRPSIKEIIDHPFMKCTYSFERLRSKLMKDMSW